MGYARYDTPAGPAGYAVTDTCHKSDCTTHIDRGLAYLCGDTPGTEGEYGCGLWYCGDHLLGRPESVKIMGGGMCAPCMKAWEDANPDLVAAEEALVRQAMNATI
jgi:hypothetical protein